jgi:hypothetical protein
MTKVKIGTFQFLDKVGNKVGKEFKTSFLTGEVENPKGELYLAKMLKMINQELKTKNLASQDKKAIRSFRIIEQKTI